MILILAVLIQVWYIDMSGKIHTAQNWKEVPTIGVQYITVCSDNISANGKPYRRRFSAADFYCNTSPHTPDGWNQSHWTIDGDHELLHKFLERSGCTYESVKFGLMIPDKQWNSLEKKADEWQCEP